jgi:transcriptional regulator with XRE-family HTH domain
VSILPMDIKKILAANVRRHRTTKGWTQEKLSIEFGVDRAYISKIERGLQNMTIDRIWHLAGLLGVTPDSLIREAADPGNPERE